MTAVGQQRDPLAAWAAVGRRRRFQISGWGRTMELGRSGRTLMMMRPPAAQLRGHRPTRGIEDQAFRLLGTGVCSL